MSCSCDNRKVYSRLIEKLWFGQVRFSNPNEPDYFSYLSEVLHVEAGCTHEAETKILEIVKIKHPGARNMVMYDIFVGVPGPYPVEIHEIRQEQQKEAEEDK